LPQLDVSRLVDAGSQVLKLEFGFEYRHSMFGKHTSRVRGVNQSSPVFAPTHRLSIGPEH